MSDAVNPYQSPREGSPDATVAPGPQLDWFVLIAWPVVFAANLIVPLILGLGMGGRDHLGGILLAVLLVLICGWGLGVMNAGLARRLVFGSVLTALSQFFPILHVFLGVIAFEICERLGLTTLDSVGAPLASSNLATFVLTLLVGSALLASAAVCGWLLGLLFPSSWVRGAPVVPVAEE